MRENIVGHVFDILRDDEVTAVHHRTGASDFIKALCPTW